jgi:hypothetical protein
MIVERMPIRVEQLEFGFRGELDIKNYKQFQRVKAMLMNLPEENLQETPANTRLLDFFRPDSIFIYTTDGEIIFGYIMIILPRSSSAYVSRKWSNKNRESEALLSESAETILTAHQIGGSRKKVNTSRRHTKRRKSKYQQK